MERRLDPDIGRILPVLPLKDAANLTPKRARDELVALTDRRKDVPLPQPAVVVDVNVDGAAGSIPARMYRASTDCYRYSRVLSRRRMGGWRLVHS